MCAVDDLARRFHTAAIVIAAAAVLIGASSRKLARAVVPEPPKEATTSGGILIHVVDADGQPVRGARIFANLVAKGKIINQRLVSDPQGQAYLELPDSITSLKVWARKAGYVPLFAHWWPEEQDDADHLPPEFTYQLQSGTVMGGVVRDEDGKPIGGAKVEVMYDRPEVREAIHKRPIFDSWLAEDESARITDEEGRWTIDNVPPGDDVRVRIKLSHPDYIDDASWGGLQKEQQIKSAALRAQTAEIVMPRGIVVSGTVTDPQGKPVAEALVIWGDRPYWQEGSQEVRTDNDGAYRFGPLPPGPMRVTVVAKRWMPELRKITIEPDLPPLDFQLKRGQKLRIQFVDRAGNAVPDVIVGIRSWRGGESLYNTKYPYVLGTNIPTRADQDGIYQWTWAPDDPVTYGFYKTGFAVGRVKIAADESEHRVTLKPLLRISGTVTDAVSGQPLQRFQVVPVIYFRPDFAMLERKNARNGSEGKFSIEFVGTYKQRGVQIEAPGYVTARSDRYRIGQPDPTLEFKLQPVERYLGKVVDQDGRPLEGAQVYVATAFQTLRLNNLKPRYGTNTPNYSVTTDEQGAFEIIPQMERYTLIVVTPDGYAEVERKADQPPGEIRARRWAKLSGRLVQAGQGVPASVVTIHPVRVSGGDAPQIEFRLNTETAEDGSFTFQRVPPVACYVNGQLHWSFDSPLTSRRSVPLALAPGEEAHVSLGGGGAEITGRLLVEDAPPDFDYHFALTYLVAQRPGIELPAILADKGIKWQTQWSDAWRSSREGAAYLKTLHHWFVKPQPDGRIRISGVEPGQYELAVNLYGSTEGCLFHPVATRVVPVTVKEGQSAVDLGTLMIPSLSLPKEGDVADNFGFVDLDGGQIDLAALRGKFVLLDFWATWCGPCVAKLDDVERLRRQYGDEGLVVVGVNLDADKLRARKFIQRKSLPWHHALLGDWSSTDVPRKFAVSSVPTYVLIDPDGRIVVRSYLLEAIAKKLAGPAR